MFEPRRIATFGLRRSHPRSRLDYLSDLNAAEKFTVPDGDSGGGLFELGMAAEVMLDEKQAKAFSWRQPIGRMLTYLGEPLEPPPLVPARGPPTGWDELVQAHDDRDAIHASTDG